MAGRAVDSHSAVSILLSGIQGVGWGAGGDAALHGLQGQQMSIPETLYCTSLLSDPSQEYFLESFSAAALAAQPGWPGMISAPSGTSEALEQAGAVWSSHSTTWHTHAGSSIPAVHGGSTRS